MRAALTPAEHLAALLAPALRLAGTPSAANDDGLDAVIARLRGHLSADRPLVVPEDQRLLSLQRFWAARTLSTLKDARLVAYGLGLPVGPAGERLIDDAERLEALFAALAGWLHEPRWYRRCFQGLLWSYFNLDAVDAGGDGAAASPAWLRLRAYLIRHAPRIVDPVVNPDWVQTVLSHRHLFTDAACAPHVPALLRGERGALETLCARLGIQRGAWFLERLVRAQIAAAIELQDAEAFAVLLPALLGDLEGAAGRVQDEGLAALLERFVQAPLRASPVALRDALARRWGLPWHPASNAGRWDALTPLARQAAEEWLKVDAIERFFADPARPSDPRRAAFWKRFTRSIRGFEPTPDGDGLVMAIGRVTVHAERELAAPLRIVEPATDRQSAPPPLLVLPHRDGVHGWRRWEQMFEDALKDHFDLRPAAPRDSGGAASVDLADPLDLLAAEAAERGTKAAWLTASAGEDVHWQTAEAAIVPYSRPDLEVLARVHALRLEDDSARSGRIWVRARSPLDGRLVQVLRRWGFTQVDGEGWHRTP